MSKTVISTLLATALSFVPFSIAAHAASEETVAISLHDSSDDASVSGMTMKIDPPTVKAGRVTLQAVNQSKKLVHEVLVVPAPPMGKELPYDRKNDRVRHN